MPPWIVLPTGCGPTVPLRKRSATQPLVMRKPSRPPYSNQLWLPSVGTTVPSPVTVATMPECAAKDCTKPPLILASTLSPNRWVHWPPSFTKFVVSVPVAIEALNGLNALVGSLYPLTRCHICQTSTDAATSSRCDNRLIHPARP